MTTSKNFGTFFLPGPTEVREEIMAAMNRPMLPHRGPQFEDLFCRLQERLRPVFMTDRPVYISSSSGTGMMEAALRNGARAHVLSLVNGAFSDRFFQIARACGLTAEALTVEPGHAHEPDAVRDALARP